MRLIDAQFLESPWHGSRQMARHLRRDGHEVSNTVDVEFCNEALQEALARFGQPEIFDTDQASQFTSLRYTSVLQQAGVRVSMDGRGCWVDNVFIERLWRSLKYDCVRLHSFDIGSELRAGLAKWIGYYNNAAASIYISR